MQQILDTNDIPCNINRKQKQQKADTKVLVAPTYADAKTVLQSTTTRDTPLKLGNDEDINK